MVEDTIKRRETNATSSIKSKNPGGLHPNPSSITPGQMVFAAEKVTKHNTRDPLLVTGVDRKKVKVQSTPEWMLWRPSNSQKARFRRMPVIRRPRLQYPRNLQEIQLGRTGNLNSA